jgi:type I restriction-modification system DNA methylase subunit
MEGNLLTNRSAIDRSKTEFYPTPPEVTIALMKYLNLPTKTIIWEPACGEGHMSNAITSMGYQVVSSDINNFGYGTIEDFLTTEKKYCDWIITNPPFKFSVEFIEKCISHNVPFALLLKSQYWHSKSRLDLFNKFKPTAILPLTWRPDFLFGQKGGAPTMECLWTVWGSEPAEYTVYNLLEKPIEKMK